MPHYFTNDNTIKNEYETTADVYGRKFVFSTSDGVFSKRSIDAGTLFLLETIAGDLRDANGVLVDLGCGYGALGVVLAGLCANLNVLMLDINKQAVSLSIRNIAKNGVSARAAVSDGLSGVCADFVVTNPPFRAGKETVTRFFRESYSALTAGGAFFAVLRKQQGAESYIKIIDEIFGNCEILRKKKGYAVVRALRTVI